MIDVGGAALLAAAARNSAGVVAVASTRATTRACPARAPGRSATSRPSSASGSPPTRSARSRRTTPRSRPTSTRSRATRSRRASRWSSRRSSDLRYGENPHQRAAFYRETTHRSRHARRRDAAPGAPPSFNNLLDLDAAYRIATDFTAPTVAIVKHTDPVGLASNDELVEAYRRALETDSVVGVRRDRRRQPRAGRRDRPRDRRELVRGGRRAGLQRSGARDPPREGRPRDPGRARADPIEGMRDYGIANLDFKRVAGGLLVETQDELGLDRGQLQVVTQRRPTLEELTDLLFAWRAVRHVRSNAIVLAKNGGDGRDRRGPGEPQRLGRDRAAPGRRPRRSSRSWRRDAYFPFPDGIPLAANAGVTAIIQPGGSIRDEMAIEVANRHHLAMVFTGRRHFRH